MFHWDTGQIKTQEEETNQSFQLDAEKTKHTLMF